MIYSFTTPDPQIELLLHEFKDVFEEPKGLPPKRTQDHQIPSLEETQPISVRPYGYPHY